MYVLYGTVQSDHIPVASEIDLQLAPDLDQGVPNNIRNNTNWSAQGDDTIHKYGVNLQLAPVLDQGALNTIRNNIDWSAQGDDTIHKYGVNFEILLRNVELPTEVLLCKECNCTKVVHKEALNENTDDTPYAITSAGQNTVKVPKLGKGKNVNRPGWKEYASDLYGVSHKTYFLRKESGSPRQGLLYNMKTRATARFIRARRFIRKN